MIDKELTYLHKDPILDILRNAEGLKIPPEDVLDQAKNLLEQFANEGADIEKLGEFFERTGSESALTTPVVSFGTLSALAKLRQEAEIQKVVMVFLPQLPFEVPQSAWLD